MADEERWEYLTHWIVVTSPTELVEMIPARDPETGEMRTPEQAVERALFEMRDRLEEHASEGAAAIDELEVLVFARGSESARFGTKIGLRRIEEGGSPDWPGNLVCEACDHYIREDWRDLGAEDRGHAEGCEAKDSEPVYRRR